MSLGFTPNISPKTLWLLFTATLLWATSFTLLYSMPRRDYEQRVGIGSLLYLLGDNTKVFVLILQVFAVISLWLVGKQAELGGYFSLFLLLALAQTPFQHPRQGNFFACSCV